MTVPLGDGGAAARERLRTDLLAWGADRPVVPTGQVEQLRRQLEHDLAACDGALGSALRTTGRQHLLVTKTRVERSICDGWAAAPAPFEHTEASVLGTLAHKAIERHLDAGPAAGRSDVQVVAAAWDELAARRPGDPRSVSAWLNACPGPSADRLRRDAAALLATFVEVWPDPAGPEVVIRTGRRLDVALAGGRVRLRGTVDLVVDSPVRDDRARALLLELRTGLPRPTQERDEGRFSALLWTLATGRPPFRWGSFAVAEGRPEVEELDLDVLAATAGRVVEVVAQADRLAGTPGEDAAHQLRAGTWCGRCPSLGACPEAARAGIGPVRGGDGRVTTRR